MTLHARDRFTIPEETVRVAREAFPKGNVYMTMRDELGAWYQDSGFAPLFTSHRGRPAESPGLLGLVTVMQFAEGLTDRQAAEAVRARIDWKYALGLRLDDPGFDFSVLSEFRDRVIAGGAEHQLLDDMLERFKGRGLLKARGRQRTDSTHILASIRRLNRLECMGETLRAALNALAVVVPDWLREQVTPEWFERYGARFEQYRLPQGKAERQRLAEAIGADGYGLLSAIYADTAAPWLREIPAVETLRRVWVQQYYVQEGQVKWRAAKDLPPSKQLISSPHDVEARNRTRRSHNWTGYTVHLTETCDEDSPNLITDVQTTPATVGDVKVVGTIHSALAEKDLLPGEHFVDAGYIDAENLVSSHAKHDIDLVGPIQSDSSWQARTEGGYDLSCFAINWETRTVTCPQSKQSESWHVRLDKAGRETIEFRFRHKDCIACAARKRCTRGKRQPRSLTLRPQAQHEALQTARQRQHTLEFKERYKIRAGIEGTISQGTRAFDLRRSRYIGLAKTHLQHVATAAAINLTRAVSWLQGIPKAQTRPCAFAALAIGP